ncbi:hypothetical protein CRE_29025 [Caenorhabditis remanei]|uniref:T-box domain-containing protein n=1 Tax=Caenorhabditis remanei TaxID=31234 RepID=E3NA59_CAERE|nr:hypothetical protein CRE_29025 [Caenorhabditis remanei]
MVNRISHKTGLPFDLNSSCGVSLQSVRAESSQLFNPKQPKREPLCEITVSLREPELWKKIHSLGNEIPVKPTGKLMFPLLNYNVTGLDPNGVYTMGIKLRRVNTKALEFKKNKIPNKWRETGQSVEHLPLESNEIFETPKRGEYWMNWGIKFEKIRIHTNGRDNQSAKYVFGKEEMLLVNTRCKCVPILTIYKIENEKKQLLKHFVFEETQFVTVGKIMNEDVIRFKAINKKNLKRQLSDTETISSDSSSSSMNSVLTSKQKTVDSISMTTSCHNKTLMKINLESREVLLDAPIPSSHLNSPTLSFLKQNEDYLPNGLLLSSSQLPQYSPPTTIRYADELEQYLPKDPIARMEFERSDLDNIIMCPLLDSTL